MPKSLTTNPDINHSYIRPVIFDIARQVLKWTGQSPEIPILFTGESEVAYQPNSTIDEEKRSIRLPSDLKFYIEVEEDYNTDKLLSIATLQDENAPYFHDDKIGIALRPIYSPAIIRLNFKLREQDSNRIRRWRDDMRLRIAQGRDHRQHVITYYYLVPIEYQNMLRHFHALREATAGYGDVYEQWLFDNSVPAVTEMVTMGGSQPQLVVTETASRVHGHFDFDVPEKASKDNDTSAHSIAFSYIVHCDVPLATAASYPPVVHNQHIDMKYIPKREDNTPEFVASRGSVSTVALRYFEKDVGIRPTFETGYRIPYYNDYRVSNEPGRCIRVLSALTSIALDDLGNQLPILNLKELKGEVYNDAWLRLLSNEHKYLNQYTTSLVYMVVTEDNEILHHSRYHVTKDLDIILTTPGDLRRMYHVGMYILRDPTMIVNPDRMLDENDVLTYVKVACPSLYNSGKLPVAFDGMFTPEQVRWIFDRVRRCNNSWSQVILGDDKDGYDSDGASSVVQTNRVGKFTVEIGKKDL